MYGTAKAGTLNEERRDTWGRDGQPDLRSHEYSTWWGRRGVWKSLVDEKGVLWHVVPWWFPTGAADRSVIESHEGEVAV